MGRRNKNNNPPPPPPNNELAPSTSTSNPNNNPGNAQPQPPQALQQRVNQNQNVRTRFFRPYAVNVPGQMRTVRHPWDNRVPPYPFHSQALPQMATGGPQQFSYPPSPQRSGPSRGSQSFIYAGQFPRAFQITAAARPPPSESVNFLRIAPSSSVSLPSRRQRGRRQSADQRRNQQAASAMSIAQLPVNEGGDLTRESPELMRAPQPMAVVGTSEIVRHTEARGPGTTNFMSNLRLPGGEVLTVLHTIEYYYSQARPSPWAVPVPGTSGEPMDIQPAAVQEHEPIFVNSISTSAEQSYGSQSVEAESTTDDADNGRFSGMESIIGSESEYQERAELPVSLDSSVDESAPTDLSRRRDGHDDQLPHEEPGRDDAGSGSAGPAAVRQEPLRPGSALEKVAESYAERVRFGKGQNAGSSATGDLAARPDNQRAAASAAEPARAAPDPGAAAQGPSTAARNPDGSHARRRRNQAAVSPVRQQATPRAQEFSVRARL
ncbi:unnamed protein product [Nezara viridula]|uniref:Uncharacterized protein n=1 Tax=Nezara viridula TaxID=85310 RepID=A0A9P0HFE5_NEZVI|nr:unnamed protein product [Nezara viridula]